MDLSVAAESRAACLNAAHSVTNSWRMAGFAVKFSPILRIAPPPFGWVTERSGFAGASPAAGCPGAAGRRALEAGLVVESTGVMAPAPADPVTPAAATAAAYARPVGAVSEDHVCVADLA